MNVTVCGRRGASARIRGREAEGEGFEPSVAGLLLAAPVSGSPDGRRWAIRAPSQMAPKTVIGLVVLFDDPVHIRRLSTGGTVPVRDAMLQYQLALRARG